MAGNVKSEDPAYPNDLKVIEEVLLRKRQGLCPTAELKNRIGFGLSGGGIRSATFCLGLFQGSTICPRFRAAAISAHSTAVF